MVMIKLSNKLCENLCRALSGICSADFQMLFSKFSAESQPAICRDTNDNLYLPISSLHSKCSCAYLKENPEIHRPCAYLGKGKPGNPSR